MHFFRQLRLQSLHVLPRGAVSAVYPEILRRGDLQTVLLWQQSQKQRRSFQTGFIDGKLGSISVQQHILAAAPFATMTCKSQQICYKLMSVAITQLRLFPGDELLEDLLVSAAHLLL